MLTAGILGVVTFLSMPEWELNNMLPILEHDLISVARGAAAPASWFNDFFLAAFLLPYVRKRDNTVRWGVVGVVGSMLVLMLFHLIILFMVGNQADKFLFPLFESFRLINLAGFLEHVDAFLLAIWLFIIFIKISLMHYAVVSDRPVAGAVGLQTPVTAHRPHPGCRRGLDRAQPHGSEPIF